jgi:hypothetical protein
MDQKAKGKFQSSKNVLNPKKVEAIRKSYASAKDKVAIKKRLARIYKVSVRTIERAIDGTHWSE